MNLSFKCKKSSTFLCKEYFKEVCEEHFGFFKVKLCCQSIALYVCCVMGKFASSGSEVIFFPVALHYLLKLPITRMRTADIQRFCLWPCLFQHSLHTAGFILQGFSAFQCMKMTFAQVQKLYTTVCPFHSFLSGLSTFFLAFEYQRRQRKDYFLIQGKTVP